MALTSLIALSEEPRDNLFFFALEQNLCELPNDVTMMIFDELRYVPEQQWSGEAIPEKFSSFMRMP